MMDIEKVREDIIKKYPSLAETVKVQSERRIWVDVASKDFRQVLEYLISRDFTILITITGLDEGENIALIYHLASKDNTIVMNLRTRIVKDKEPIRSVIDLFRNSELYEREIVDLLGVDVQGLPPGMRYPLPDDWPAGSHPLRKDWKDPSKQGKEKSNA